MFRICLLYIIFRGDTFDLLKFFSDLEEEEELGEELEESAGVQHGILTAMPTTTSSASVPRNAKPKRRTAVGLASAIVMILLLFERQLTCAFIFVE